MIKFRVLCALLLLGIVLSVNADADEIEKSPLYLEDEVSMRKIFPYTNRRRTYFHLFNTTNIDEYLNDKEVNIEVNEIEPFVYDSQVEIDFLNFSDKNLAYFSVIEKSHLLSKPSNFDENFKLFFPDPLMVKKLNDPDENVDGLVESPAKLFKLLDSNEIEDFLGINMAKMVLVVHTGRVNKKNFGNVRDLISSDPNSDEVIEKAVGEEAKCCDRIPTPSKHILLPFFKSLTDNESITLYDESLDGAANYQYLKNALFNGKIRVRRYGIESFDSKKLKNEDCRCYDKNQKLEDASLCDIKGIIMSNKCGHHSIYYSNPHFLDGSFILFENINGLKPDILKHLSYFDLDPKTQIVVNSTTQMQLNYYLKVTRLGFKNRDALVPVFMGKEVDEMSAVKQKKFYGNL